VIIEFYIDVFHVIIELYIVVFYVLELYIDVLHVLFFGFLTSNKRSWVYMKRPKGADLGRVYKRT